MGLRAYSGEDVQQGIGGFAKVKPPSWTGWRRPIWCQLICENTDVGTETWVSVLGWEDPGSDKPGVLEWEEFDREDQEKLLTTISQDFHKHFLLKP